MRPLLKLWLAALGIAPLCACDAGSGPPAAPIPTTEASLPRSTRSLLQRMIAAATHVRFQGERHVEAHWKIGDTRYDMQYRERISADGQGQFSIEPLDLEVPDVSTQQEHVFLMLSHSREGFFWRYRDFRIHHLASFLRNYVVIDTGAVVQVLGRDCASLVVKRATNAEQVYRLQVDLTTGVVLRCSEETRNGAVLCLSEFVNVDFAPDLSRVAWHQPAVDEAELADPSQPLEVGAGAGLPQLVDGSFVLLSAKQITAQNAGVPEKYARYVYSDGLEVVFLIYGGNVRKQGQVQTRTDDVAQVMPSFGPWQIVVATIHDERLIGMGKMGHGELLDLIASALR